MGIYRDLEGKRVVITGAASGIGQATAQRFVEEGAQVIIFDWNQQTLDETLSLMPGLRGGVCVDVSEPEQVQAGFAQVDELVGGVDVLISNAGISFRKPFLEISYEQWSKVLRVNLDGMFLCAQAAIRRMKPQRTGVVLFTASVNGDYNAAKAGIISLAQTLALEFAPWLRVNAVCPGYTLTAMQQAEYTEEMMAAVNADIPMNRHAQPAEIAAFFAFLASNQSPYITGQALVIDGGGTAGQYLKGLDT
jgi:NAD(P)-dependent dehydrogenase (short-subunit alcohol dehydrogenase family)